MAAPLPKAPPTGKKVFYIDTGIRTHTNVPPANGFGFWADFRERFAIARAGLNYKFGNDAVTARY